MGDRAMPYTKVIGHRWTSRSWEVRQFLARNGYPFKALSPPTNRRASNCSTPRGSTASAARRHHRGRARRWSNRPTSSWPTLLGLSTNPSAGDVRPRRHRRRARGAGRRGVRRLRGAQHRAHRAGDHRRSGGAQFQDRELPRVRERRLRCRAHHDGTTAGRTLRRRGHHHPGGDQAEIQATSALRAPSRSKIAAPSARVRSSSPPASTTESFRSPAAGHDPTTPTRRISSAAGCTTAPRSPTPSECATRTSTSSVAPTRPVRPRCSCRRRPSRSPC